ncbi:MAG: hypothetical protein RIR18_2044 [Pseudomonadota bacterium]|jgi:cytochrome bd-type quinol oxidase subunit 2
MHTNNKLRLPGTAQTLKFKSLEKNKTNEKNKRNTLETIDNTLSLISKSIPTGGIIAAVIIWLYLDHIGRLDLYIRTISNPAGLALLIAAGLSFAAFLLITLIPSIYFKIASSYIQNETSEPAARDITRWLRILAVCLFIGISAAISTKIYEIISLSFTVAILIYLLPILLDCNNTLVEKHFFGKSNSRGIKLLNITLLTIMMFYGGLLTLLPLLVIDYSMFNQAESNVTQMAFAAIGLGLLPALSLLPVYSHLVSKNNKQRNIKEITLITTITTAALFIFLFPTENLIYKTAVTKIGIRSQEILRYSIESKKISINDLINPTWNPSDKNNTLKVSGIIPFQLNNLILLCPPNLRDSDIELKNKSRLECIVMDDKEIKQLPTAIESE